MLRPSPASARGAQSPQLRRMPRAWRPYATAWKRDIRAATPDAVIFGENALRLPNTTLFAVLGMKAETAHNRALISMV